LDKEGANIAPIFQLSFKSYVKDLRRTVIQ